MTNTVFKTVVGSHMWGMNHKDSDIDYFICYSVPTRDILSGVANIKSSHTKHGIADYAKHEVGIVVNQLLKGNVNFLWGVMSPVVEKSSKWHRELKRIVKKNVSKNCYNSIYGLAVHNYKKYIESGRDVSEKRCNIIARTIEFGINLLSSRKIVFRPVHSATPEMIENMLDCLYGALLDSSLPDKPNEKPFREWLLNYRLMIL